MRKVYFFSFLLVLGLVLSQILPHLLGGDFGVFKSVTDSMLYISLAFIMINVGREFEINKKQWRSYTVDYFVAMGAAAFPWILVALYYIFAVAPPELQIWKNGDIWKETFLLSRYAAPTSAGILFTMLAAAGLRYTWVYKKVQVLAIFDDLDTILLMIPLQILMIGMRWQMFVILVVAVVLIWLGWKKMNSYGFRQDWKAILFFAVLLFVVIHAIYLTSKHFYGESGSIHIEILLPAFILGMIMRADHSVEPGKTEVRVANSISYLFMMLVGLSMPLFLGVDFVEVAENSASHISQIPMLPWGTIAFHVFMVTLISNLGKLFPLAFYRDRKMNERLAVSIGMFTRGEVGAGVLFIAIGYHMSGVLLIISVLAMCLNLLFTGFFIGYAKKLAMKSAQEELAGEA
ncbi:MAG TPA: sodium:proton antiporter [Proteiniphilum sp.]|nr:sodium:proton antiporter [Proteiniphilum sp.]HPD86397.1 sodium:proton antiporter [Proteiniphilum sp.]HPJ51071.1 sodium:proton antiporter [Proteiniphilum sp.]HPR20340.1 sodium:proton antiporter [Proteiniphilum sp.]